MTSPLKFSELEAPEPISFTAKAESLDSMAAHERLREVTAILATGIHRFRSIRSALPECGQIPAESSQTGLDPVARTCPDGAVSKRRENGRSMNAH